MLEHNPHNSGRPEDRSDDAAARVRRGDDAAPLAAEPAHPDSASASDDERPGAAGGEEIPGAAELAARERHAARTLNLGTAAYVLAGVAVIYLVSLFLPQVTGVRGWQVVTFSDAAGAAGVKMTEYVFSLLCLAGLGVFTTLAVLTRRTWIALVAWMITTVGVAYALLAMWLRGQRPGAEAHITAEVGTYLMIACVIVACATYSMTALRRSPEQAAIARQRARADAPDEIEQAQAAAATTTAGEDNPLLVDDRRARARKRAERAADKSKDRDAADRPQGR